VLHIHTVALFFPPFESDLTAGTTLLVIPKPSAIWGVAICKDMGGLTREDRVPDRVNAETVLEAQRPLAICELPLKTRRWGSCNLSLR